jgi:signal transduction histidine kinase
VRIAHDLHDGVGQLLNVAKLKLAAVDAGAKRVQVEEIAQIIDQTNAAIRTLEFELSPPVLRELGLVPALTWLADEMLRQYNLKVDISDDYQPIALDQLSRAVVFRAVRELLINVARHAGTNRAEVHARRLNDALELTITDEGLGFAMNVDERGETRGLGLVGVRERIAAIGGSSEFHSAPGSGTVVVLRVPLAIAVVSGRAIA